MYQRFECVGLARMGGKEVGEGFLHLVTIKGQFHERTDD